MKCRLLILSILLAFDASLSYSQKAETKNETENLKTTEKPRRVYHTIRLATANNPDFNFTQFRSNLVLKWEYKPGSQLYFVWSNERTEYDGGKYIPLKAATRDIWDATSNNIFMLKFNYWFTL